MNIPIAKTYTTITQEGVDLVELLCVGIKNEFDKAYEIINDRLFSFQGEDFNINLQRKTIGNTVFISYDLENNYKKRKHKEINDIFKHYVATAISEIILKYYQEKIINRLLLEKCAHFKWSDREMIKKNTIDDLNKNDYTNASDIVYRISKKARITKTVIEYLEQNDEINIEGFVNFRLKFLIDIIDETLDKNIEDFIMEREYREFIKVLQYFVDIQEPKLNTVNVIIKENKYLLYDDDNKKINNDFLEEVADEIVDETMSYDDLLISSLITIAPRNIVIHIIDRKNIKVVDVIKSIFVNKTTICKGCCLCSSEILGKKEKK
ncbi:sporulation protein YtxC [Dethiothermospora halolimnae]|uniref:sporulation protein YtxC n=1 Tax=Dethiothermospora halolimnae TaxID=3114390 RepID=UPI003CCC12BD